MKELDLIVEELDYKSLDCTVVLRSQFVCKPWFLVCLFQILTDEDFKKIRLREIAKQIDPKVGKKRKRGADNTGPTERFVLQSVITENFSLQI